MITGLYFGSFNPVHTGHLIIGNHVLNQKLVDELWFVVSPQNPFKPAAGLLNEHHRLHMVQKAMEDVPGLSASNVEFSLPKPSYTIDTLTYLKEKYPARDFVIVMGSDGFQNIEKWKNADFLKRDHKLIIYPRPGFEVNDNKGWNITIAEAPLLDISSTYIRQLIKDKKDIRFLVTEPVRAVIESNNYYH